MTEPDMRDLSARLEHEGQAKLVGTLLRGRTLVTAESCTAGLVAQTLAATEGSMDWFRGGLVAYQSDVKHELLSVEPGPVVTESTACQMALGATRLLSADVAVSVTGVAGPEPLDGVEPGVVIVGVATDGKAAAFTHRFSGDPAAICSKAAEAALDDLVRSLGEQSEA
jgi:PncC family amidohydrolase